jgi:ABC-type transporter MlaC component
MIWAGDHYRAATAEHRRRNVLKYGEDVVRVYEQALERYPLELANYNNVRHLLRRDGYDEGPPPYPSLEATAQQMRGD